jgi:hypothetical protein
MKTQYEFEPLGNSPEEGYNDPLKTIFGNRVETVTREAFQNSIDAIADEAKPVRVRVALEQLSSSEIPDVDRLKKILEACAEACKEANTAQGVRHFKHGVKVLKSGNIPTLVISDFNTTGLTGTNDDKRSKYYNFFKSVGGHNKPPGAAGSYGFGKTTNMAFSEIDTFFATSNHGEGLLFMGCLRVCSHTIDGKVMRGVGSYGLRGQLPVRDVTKIPKAFLREHRRNERGTDVFIPVYKDHGDWKENTIKSALKNFWLAIHEGKLEVEVGDLLIQRSNIEQVMRQYFPANARAGKWRIEDPLPYFEAYTRGNKTTEELPTLGKVDCYLLAGDQRQSTGYVACFRKNLMLIQHKRFDSIVPYSGVFVCTDKRGNAVLQDLEPPQHDSWDKTVLHAQDENGQIRPECVAADKEYRSFLRDKISKLLGSKTTKRIELASLNRFILIKNTANRTRSKEALQGAAAEETENQGLERVRQTSVVLEAHHPEDAYTAKAPVNEEQSDDLGAGTEEDAEPNVDTDDGAARGNGKGEDPPNAEGVEPGQGKKTERIARATVRAIPSLQNGILNTNVIIRTSPPRPRKQFRIVFKAGTDDGFEALEVATVSPQGQVGAKGDISGVMADQDGKINLIVTFRNNSKYSLKAEAYEVK